MSIRRIALLSIFLLTLSAAGAQQSGTAGSGWGDGLLEALEEASDIAAQERLNIDEIPEFTTVLRSEELRAAGVQDLFDALSLVPGIQTSVMQNGIKKVVMRGYDNPNSFVFDKFKLIIDGYTVDTVDFQNTSYYLSLPIELIERIEVVLGPAAALETSGALTGVIKLFTKSGSEKTEGSLFVHGGSYAEVMGGTVQSYALGDETRLSLDGYYKKHDRMLDADDYALPNTLARDPESSEWLKDFSVGATLRYKKLKITGRIKREHQGNYFGWEEYLEQSTKRGMTARHVYLQGSYEDDLSSMESLRLSLAYSHFRYDADAQNYIGVTHDSYLPYTLDLKQSEAGMQMEASINSRRIENHDIQMGWHGFSSRQYSNDLDIELPTGATIDTTLTRKDLKRYLSSFYLTDSVSMGEKVDGHFALRYDHLSDIHKGYYSLDATLLYRPWSTLTVKGGYGHAYRAPSWVELHTIHLEGLRAGNPDLEAEEADTIEGSLIFTPSMRHLLKLNLYYTNVDNLIDNREISGTARASEEPEYDNYKNRESKGFELGYRYRPSPVHTLKTACAYNDTEYVTEKQYAQSMPGVAHWSGYLLYRYNPNASTTLSARVQYMGPRKAYHDYGRDDVSSYTTVDATYSYIAPSGWKCYATVKNLFDEEVRDSSYYERHDGIIRPGRRFFVTVEFPL